MMLLAIAIVGVAGGAFAFRTAKGHDINYFGCDSQLPVHKCTATKTFPNAQVSTNPLDPTFNGSSVSLPNQACTSDANCGTIRYTVSL